MAVFPIYFVLFLPYIVTEIFSKFIKSDKKILLGKIEICKNNNLKNLILICVVAALLGLVNPSGLTPYTYTAKILQGTTMNYINEHSPITWDYLRFNKPYLIAYALVLIVLIYPKQEVKLQDIFMLGGLTILSFLGVRQFAIFFAVTSRIFAKYINKIKEKILGLKVFKDDKFLILRIGITIICIFVIFYGSIKFHNKYGNKPILNEIKYPVKAAEWIKDNLDLKKLRIYNNYAEGSYLILVGIPDFIDSRCDLFTTEFNKQLEEGGDIFEDCMLIQETGEYRKIFEKYNINACLINKSEICFKYLETDEEFENVYEDEEFVVYIKKEM